MMPFDLPRITSERNRQGIEVWYCGHASATSREAIEWERARFAQSVLHGYRNIIWC